MQDEDLCVYPGEDDSKKKPGGINRTTIISNIG